MTDLYTTNAPAPDPRGTVVLVHGLGEHSGRYGHVIDALNRARWSVVAYDQRGHGRSPGKRGALPHPDALLDDLAQILDGVDAQRRILLGHSMGGTVVARFVAEERRPVDGLILSSPALRTSLGLADRMKLAAGERLAPNAAVSNGLDATKISHDPAVVKAYRDDPLVHDRVTPRLVRFILDSGDLVRARARLWRVRTLLMWAGDDRLVDPRGSRELAWNAPEGVIAAREFPGLYHEIFNESDPDVLGTMVKWLQ
ncbi:MAG TPA: alpha/beta hydrolase [Thermoanaerobaculia bacterium]|nr:alpha/beta hydrolase [Thermoanaerobaculia bacterium]